MKLMQEFVKAELAPFFKSLGFKKKGLMWNRSVSGKVEVLGLQVATYSKEGMEEYFTINMGIFEEELWRVCWDKEVPKFPRTEECFPRVRVGQLLLENGHSSKDKWWECAACTVNSVLGKDVRGVVSEFCLPFFTDMAEFGSVRELYNGLSGKIDPVDKVYLAIKCHWAGDENASEELLKEVSSLSEGWKNRVEVVRLKLR
ncbi:DUF4304 domain-containing protein [Thalassospira sp.]|uniref:DUF4304 domain-containing protein n=1 Tax=Thalassospira sp. TaxID=1912094 RepID=UPI0032EBF1B0